jgi:hypothetical protein
MSRIVNNEIDHDYMLGFDGRFGVESGHPTWANVRSHQYRTFKRPGIA